MSKSDFTAKALKLLGKGSLPFFIQGGTKHKGTGARSDRGRGFHLWLHRFLKLNIPVESYLHTLWNAEGFTEQVLIHSQKLWNIQGPVKTHTAEIQLTNNTLIIDIKNAILTSHNQAHSRSR
jgi:hypothetical protein